jgi:hypothetical protein
MTVSLIEITFYISALHVDPAMMPSVSLELISACSTILIRTVPMVVEDFGLLKC